MPTERTVESAVPRVLPTLNDLNRAFWTGGANGELLILWDVDAERWVHPTSAAAPGANLEPRPVSGLGTVFTYTINHHQYHPDVEPPYVIAIVELDEQSDLRLPTNIVGCAPDDVAVGMSVKVGFERHEDIYVPVFMPVEESTD